MMKSNFRMKSSALLIALGLMGLLTAAVVTMASAKQPDLPDYLQTAKYLTSAKCKMCHKAQFTAWSATKHALPNGFPWEADKTAKPAPEDIYRHTTGFNPADNTYAEKGTACEACHGPGSAHMMAKTADRPATIVLPTKLATNTQKLSVCGRCHGQYSIGDKRYAANFLPGMDLFEIEGIKLDPPSADPNAKMQQLNEFMQSKMSKTVACENCHSSHAATPLDHNLAKPVVELCSSCHKDKTLAAHAPNAPKDATCATCHMPNGRHDFVLPKQ